MYIDVLKTFDAFSSILRIKVFVKSTNNCRKICECWIRDLARLVITGAIRNYYEYSATKGFVGFRTVAFGSEDQSYGDNSQVGNSRFINEHCHLSNRMSDSTFLCPAIPVTIMILVKGIILLLCTPFRRKDGQTPETHHF